MTTPPGPPPESSDRPDHETRGYYPPPDGSDPPAGMGGYQSYPGGPGQPGDRYAGAATGDPLVPADFGGWFQLVIGVTRRSFVPLALIVLISAVVNVVMALIVVSALPELATAGFGSPANPIPPDRLSTLLTVVYGTGLISIVVTAFVYAAGLVVAVRHAGGRAVAAGHGLAAAAGRVGPIIGWGLLAGIMFLIGSALLVIPGIYIGVVLFSSLVGVVMVERDGIGRCFTLIRNRWWATFGRLLVSFLLIGVYSLIIYGIGSLLGGPYSLASLLFRAVLAVPGGVVTIAVITVTYAELRSHEHAAVGTPRLNAELDR